MAIYRKLFERMSRSVMGRIFVLISVFIAVLMLSTAVIASYQTIKIDSSQQIEIIFNPTPSTPDSRNLIQNGFFLEDFTGWTRDLVDEGGSSKIKIINSQNSPFNRALWMEQTGLGNVSMAQYVPISTLDLTFSATFSTSATTGPIFGFSESGYAIIAIDYLNDNDESLGFTRILNVNESAFAGSPAVGAPDKISDTNTVHNIMIESDKVYKNFTVNLSKEIKENLLGINPSDVRALKIVMIVGSNDKGASGTLTISDIVLK